MTSTDESKKPTEDAASEPPPAEVAASPEGEAPVAAEPASEDGAAPEGDASANGENGANGDADPGVIRAGSEEYWVEAKGAFQEKDVTGYMPSPESTSLLVEVPEYEGPLDLLLHLITRHALDIFDIPIARITEEYLKILDDMRALNLDVAGEFLLMAARLAHIKSKMLLPREEGEGDDDEDLGDPRLELVRRLIEYSRFRDVAEQLGEYPRTGRDLFMRPRQRPDFDTSNPDDPLGTGLQEFDVGTLIGVLEEVLKRSKKKIVHEVIAERLNVGARINELVDYAREREHFTFSDIIDTFGGVSRGNLIVTFLAVLEMCKLKLLRLHQPDTGNSIYISPVMENLEPFADDDEEVIQVSAGARSSSYDYAEPEEPEAPAPLEAEAAPEAEAHDDSEMLAEPEPEPLPVPREVPAEVELAEEAELEAAIAEAEAAADDAESIHESAESAAREAEALQNQARVAAGEATEVEREVEEGAEAPAADPSLAADVVAERAAEAAEATAQDTTPRLRLVRSDDSEERGDESDAGDGEEIP
jgi:segregation and condensation protein A